MFVGQRTMRVAAFVPLCATMLGCGGSQDSVGVGTFALTDEESAVAAREREAAIEAARRLLQGVQLPAADAADAADVAAAGADAVYDGPTGWAVVANDPAFSEGPELGGVSTGGLQGAGAVDQTLSTCEGQGSRCLLRGSGTAVCDWGEWRCGGSGAGYCEQTARCRNASPQTQSESLSCDSGLEGTPCHLNGGEVGVCGLGQMVCLDGVPVCGAADDGGTCQIGGEPGRVLCVSGVPQCSVAAPEVDGEADGGSDGGADCLMSATHDAGPPWPICCGLLALAFLRRRWRVASARVGARRVPPVGARRR